VVDELISKLNGKTWRELGNTFGASRYYGGHIFAEIEPNQMVKFYIPVAFPRNVSRGRHLFAPYFDF